ncbi:MAG: hypothetical protein ACTS22_01690 [Phycisphaerales bacterium]
MHNDARDRNAAHPLAEPALDADAFDELTDLFLGGEQPDSDHHPSPRRSATAKTSVRALVVGHLPVAASPWVAQHARDTARATNAPVALLSISSGHASLAVFGGDIRHAPASPDTLEDAIRAAHRLGVATWLVRTDALAELALAEHPRIDAVTLLTGADEAALVNAYRALKALTAAAPGYEPSVPALHLAVLGSPSDQARAAAEKLRRAAQSFLDAGLTSVTLTEKIAPGQGLRLYDGAADRTIHDILGDLPTHTTTATEPAARPSPIDPAAPQAASQTPALRLARSDHASRIGPVPHAPAAEPTPVPPPIPAAVSVAPTIAALRPEHHARHGNNDDPMNLARLLGLTPLEPRCPYADEVELAADDEGRAHLIVHAQGAAHAIPGALESLEIARTWLGAHLTILAAATGDAIRVSPPREPAAHLVVDHAAAVRRLLDAPVRMYVLAEGRAESLCVPLN